MTAVPRDTSHRSVSHRPRGFPDDLSAGIVGVESSLTDQEREAEEDEH